MEEKQNMSWGAVCCWWSSERDEKLLQEDVYWDLFRQAIADELNLPDFCTFNVVYTTLPACPLFSLLFFEAVFYIES